MSRPGFNFRAFVSLLTTFCFVALVVTGLVLYVEPYGRIAYWTDWTLGGLGKKDWDGIHIIIGAIFLVVAVIHAIYNWTALVRYLTGKVRDGVKQWKEPMAAGALVVLAVVGAAAEWPPFSWVLDLSDRAKSAWSTQDAEEPPFGHAEMSTVASLCEKLGMDQQRALANLQQAGIRVDGPHQSVEDVAKGNGIASSEVFDIMERDNGGSRGRGLGRRFHAAVAPEEQLDDRAPAADEVMRDELEHEHDHALAHSGQGRGLGRGRGNGQGRGLRAGEGVHGGRRGGGGVVGAGPSALRTFERYAGRGLGRRSVASLCSELGLPADEGMAALSEQGIDATPGQSVKSVATKNGIQPAALLAALCKNGGCK